MHILYIHQYFCPPGGAGNNRSLDLARAWVQAGHEVTMLTSTAYFPAAMQARVEEPFDCDGIQVIPLNVPYRHTMPFGRRVIAFLQFYRRAIKTAKGLSKPDLVYASSTPLTVGELGRRLGQYWAIPFVFETVDVWPDAPIGMGILRNRFLIGWLDRLTNRIYDAAAAIVALSDGMQAQILSHGVPTTKVQVHYNGTDLQAFPFVEREAGARMHVVYTGTVGLANGVDVIPKLCKRLTELGRSDIHITVLGDGNAWASVKELSDRLGLGNLDFLPTIPKEQVASFLVGADVGLVTFAPYKVLEANSANKFYDYLASGLPVVINYRGWQASYLAQWGCGLSSDQSDLNALVQNIVMLADDPARRSTMGKNGRQLAESQFDRAKIGTELLHLFQGILTPPTGE
jgi:glycosyltransferase involved in cell wall biosynthesis